MSLFVLPPPASYLVISIVKVVMGQINIHSEAWSTDSCISRSGSWVTPNPHKGPGGGGRSCIHSSSTKQILLQRAVVAYTCSGLITFAVCVGVTLVRDCVLMINAPVNTSPMSYVQEAAEHGRFNFTVFFAINQEAWNSRSHEASGMSSFFLFFFFFFGGGGGAGAEDWHFDFR